MERTTMKNDGKKIGGEDVALRRRRRGGFCVLLIIVSVLMFGFGIRSFAYTKIYAKPVEYRDLAEGVRYELHEIFTDEGWISVHAVRSRLSSSDAVIPLYPEVLTKPETLTEMVNRRQDQDTKILAAINGDYFDYQTRSVLGRIVENGEVVQTSNMDPDMSGLKVYSDGKIRIDYEKIKKKAVSNGRATIGIDYMNKAYALDHAVLAFDEKFGSKTPAISEKTGYIVVKEGKVRELKLAETSEPIAPGTFASGTYVLQIPEAKFSFFGNEFRVGDVLTLHTDLDYDTGISGGSKIVSGGRAVTDANHNVTGLHPRTAVGVEKDGKTMVFATVNGRSDSYRGMTQNEFAAFLANIGVYEAMMLDGGGSTEMIVDEPYAGRSDIVSYLSDGAERSVYNGLAIKGRRSVTGVPKQLKFSDRKAYCLTGIPMELRLQVLDSGFFPMTAENVEYRVLGLNGNFDGSFFVPSEEGSGTIIARIPGVKAEAAMNIHVSKRPVELVVKTEVVKPENPKPENPPLNDGENTAEALLCSFFLNTEEGYRVSLPREYVTVTLFEEAASYDPEGGLMTLNRTDAEGYATFEYRGADGLSLTKSIALKLEDADKMLEDFEDAETGESPIDLNVVNDFGGNGKVGMIRYEPLEEGTSKQKYARGILPKSLSVPRGSKTISVDIFNQQNTDASVLAAIKDSRGIRTILVAEKLDWIGWKKCSVPLEGELFGEQMLEMFLVEAGESRGEVYFDNIRVEASDIAVSALPPDRTTVKGIEDYRISSADATRYRVDYTHSSVAAGENGNPAGFSDKFLYLEILNDGGLIREHYGQMQWANLIEALKKSPKPILIRFSGTYYFRDKKEKDLLFSLIEQCNQPVFLVFRAYRGQTDIFRKSGAYVIEIKDTEAVEITDHPEFQIVPVP